MSEKRFTDVNVDFEQSWIRLKDNGYFLIFPISFNDKEEYGLETLEDLLNSLSDKIDEKQATISQLEKNFDDLVKWASEIANRNVVLDEQIGELQRENEQLRQQLKEKEEDEQLYANEILELRKTNEEWIQFKDLGGDY